MTESKSFKIGMIGGSMKSFMGNIHREAIAKAGNLKIVGGAFGTSKQASYDFIKPLNLHTFAESEKAELLAENGEFAEETGRHIACVGDMLTNLDLSSDDWKKILEIEQEIKQNSEHKGNET